jgi:hypothetical protein
MVLTAVLGRDGEGRTDGAVLERGGEGRVDGAVLGRFDVEEERGVGARGGGHAVEEDVEEERAPTGVWWRNDRVRV